MLPLFTEEEISALVDENLLNMIKQALHKPTSTALSRLLK